MEALSFILSLALLILLAKILGELAEKIKLPSLVGEVLAGIILGPQLLNMLGFHDVLNYLAEIGIILLIFTAGFEHGTIKELLRYKSTSILISIFSCGIHFAIIVAFSYYLGFNLLTSLFIAIALSATSMGVSIRSLFGINEIDTRIGKTVIGSLVLNDILGLILLTIVASYAEIVTGGSANLWIQIAKVIASITLFFVIFYFGSMYLPKLTTFSVKFRVEEAQFSLAIVLILLSAWSASYFGLSSIIGAFFAGIILSRSPIFESHTFIEKISSLSHGFFIPIFFAVIGSQLIFANFTANILRAILFFVVIDGLLVLGGFIACKINKYSNREAVIVGLGLLPYGEVTLVVMSTLIALANAKPQYFIGQDITSLFSSILLLIILTIIMTPLLMRLANWLMNKPTLKPLKVKKNVRTA
ncbi:cation:proton antiporter [Candidatus Woesearchaeota archaeon]|nr:cation:proton antiporter [Candidatus Woesearchaeota archaeon]